MIAIGRTRVRNASADRVHQEHGIYKSLLHRLHAVNASESPLGLVGVTSCVRGEGVSTIAANLAIGAAEESERGVLLVDANFEHPSMHHWFELSLEPGIQDVGLRDAHWREAVQSTQFRGLDVLTAGRTDGSEPFLEEHESRLNELATEWRESYDLVVLDLPSVGRGEVDLPFATRLDGVVMVVEAERVSWQDACRAKELLKQAQLKVFGAVLNKRNGHLPDWLARLL